MTERPNPPTTLLLVEDDEHQAAYLALQLRQRGYLVDVAHNGADAVRLAKTTCPDAIIMDIVLPGEIDGIEAARRIRAEREVPILYLTADGQSAFFERARSTDPSAYLLKPFNQRELELAIELAIHRHRLTTQREQNWHTRVSRLMETMTDGFVVLDQDWRYAYMNRQAGELLNRVPAMMIGKMIWDEFPDRVNQPCYQAYQRVMHERGPLQIENYDESWSRWFEHRIFPFEGGISIYIHEITERKQVERQLSATSQHLQALSARLLTVQEDERRQLARELHDELGQSLTALKITLQSLGLRPETAALRAQVETALSIADTALTQARQMSINLRPPQLDDLGLAAALRWNLARQARLAGLPTHFDVDDLPRPVSEPVAIACYRIAQEALTNVLRHAHARNVWVRLQLTGDELRFELQDDGAGFDPKSSRFEAGSMGVLGMQERALLAGGGLEIESSPGRGCLVRAIFPITPGAVT